MSGSGDLTGLGITTRELLDAMGVPALLTDPDRVALWTNQQFCDLFGVTVRPESLVGRSMTPLAHEVSRQFHDPAAFLHGIVEAIRGGVPVVGTTLERCDGRVVSRSYQPVRVDGVLLAHMWRYDDVTELHRRHVALERSTKVLEAMVRAQGPAVRHATGREVFTALLDGLIDVSGSAYGFVGEIVERADAPGTRFLRSWAISDIAWDVASRDYFESAMSDTGYLEFHELDSLYGVTVRSGQMVIANDPEHDPRAFGLPPGHPPLGAYLGLPIHHDGRLIGMAGLAGRPGGFDAEVVASVQPLIAACGSLIDAYVIERERRSAESALRRALAAAERANAAKTHLLGRVSHELRTPLNAVLGYAQLLATDDPDPRRLRWIAQVEDAGRHVLAQVEDLLDLAAAESGRLTVELDAVEVDTTVAAVLELVAPLAAERRVEVRHVPSSHRVVADGKRLRVVLINLVSNAVKYNCEGGHVTVSSTVVDDGRVCITVGDDGPGIPADEFERAFEMFERLDDAAAVPGTGLGLAIARQYTTAMGGTLEGRPAPGGGAELLVYLPASAPTADVASRRPWVLYVEDNAMNADLVVEYLGSVDHVAVEVAMTLGEGRRRLAAGTPALVLLDLNLPDGFGGDLAAELTSARPDLPVVLVTADAFAAERLATELPTLAGALVKPIDLRELSAVVGRYVAA